MLSAINVSVYQWSLPLSGSLPGCPDGERRGMLLWLEKEGLYGLGDCAPLPGFSVESLAEASDALVTCARQLAASPEKLAEINDFGLLNTVGHSLNVPSSVIFAVEAAVDELMMPINSKAFMTASKGRSVCRLLAGGNRRVLDAAHTLDRDTTLVKIKVARQSVAEDVALVKQLDTSLPDHVMIRLDGNRGWNLDQALHFSKAIPRKRICFVEEPLIQSGQLSEYVAKGGLPVALDESLHSVDSHSFHSNSAANRLPGIFDGLAALVVKPTLAGGVYRCRQLAALAREYKLELVISSSYESNIGIGTLARLAEREAPDTAPGLDTLSIFQKRLIHGSQTFFSEMKPPMPREQHELHEAIVLREQLQLIWSSHYS